MTGIVQPDLTLQAGKPRGLISKDMTDRAKIDEPPQRLTMAWHVGNRVGVDGRTGKIPEGIKEQTENALRAIDRCFKKVDLTIGDYYQMDVSLGNMRDRSVVEDCIKAVLYKSGSRWTPSEIERLPQIIFRKVRFKDPEIKIMIQADEYHGR